MTALSRTTKSLEISLTGDRLLPQGPSDSVSSLAWSPVGDFLAIASWDNSVRVYEVNSATGDGQGRAMYSHEAPVLSVGWWHDGTKLFSGGCDNAVRSYDIASGQTVLVGTHDQPVSGVALVDVGQPMIASVSWDRTLKYWDLRSPNPVAVVQLPERAYALSTNKKLLVIACANKRVVLINLDNPSAIFKTVESPLKQQTQSLACQTDASGFALGTAEGRCGIQYVNQVASNTNFTFKCHRKPAGTTTKPVDQVYAVAALGFHPQFNSLVTAGSDGTFHFWDKDSRHRLGFTKPLPDPITAIAFNAQGTLFAYSSGYDWSKGHQFNKPGKEPVTKVHKLQEWEVKPKAR